MQSLFFCALYTEPKLLIGLMLDDIVMNNNKPRCQICSLLRTQTSRFSMYPVEAKMAVCIHCRRKRKRDTSVSDARPCSWLRKHILFSVYNPTSTKCVGLVLVILNKFFHVQTLFFSSEKWCQRSWNHTTMTDISYAGFEVCKAIKYTFV